MKAVRRTGLPREVSGPFVFSWSAVGACAVVRVAGRIDEVTAPELETELRRVITTKQPTVVVDLRRVVHLGQAAADALTRSAAVATEHDGWLRVCGLSPASVLFGPEVQQYPTLPEALPTYRPAVVVRSPQFSAGGEVIGTT